MNEVSIEISKPQLCTSCLICGNTIPLDHFCDPYRVCDECKYAIKQLKEMLEQNNRPN